MTSERDEPKAPRKHTTTACEHCRLSKIKCDGNRPCGNCIKKSRAEVCGYSDVKDKRKIPLRHAIEVLSRRIVTLTNTLRNNGISVPQCTYDEKQTIIDACDGVGIAWLDVVGDNSAFEAQNLSLSTTNVSNVQHPGDTRGALPESSKIQRNNIQQPLPQSQPQPAEAAAQVDWTWNGPTTSGPQSPADWPWALWDPHGGLTWAGNLPGASGYNPVGTTDADLSWVPEHININPELPVPIGSSTGSLANEIHDFDDRFIDQFSTRFGSLKIGSGGKTKYVGPASNAQFLEDHDSQTKEEEEDLRIRRDQGQLLLKQASLGGNVDPNLETKLIDFYFVYQESTIQVVDREMYELARRNALDGRPDRGYYSEGLRNAICALGAAHEARFHPALNTYPKPMAEFFADRVKALLLIELEHPTVATVQALILLSCHLLAFNKDAGGWIYSGMAMRLCLDLGLERDCSRFVRQGLISPEEAKARAMAFWGCFVMNHLWSFYLGRPFRVEGVIDVDRPRNTEPFYHIIWLCETAGPAMHDLFASFDMPIPELQTRTSNVTEKLFNWPGSLPRDIRVDFEDRSAVYSPELLMLHMIYHQLLIILHRPWTSTSNQPQPNQGRGFMHARGVCISSAKDIGKLLALYERRYPFTHMHVLAVQVISSAALVVIALRAGSPETRRADIEQQTASTLAIYFRALEELSHTYEKAKSVRNGLLSTQRKWMDLDKTTSAGGRLKRMSTPGAQGTGTGSKRIRNADMLQGSMTSNIPLSMEQQQTFYSGGGDPWSQHAFNPTFPP